MAELPWWQLLIVELVPRVIRIFCLHRALDKIYTWKLIAFGKSLPMEKSMGEKVLLKASLSDRNAILFPGNLDPSSLTPEGSVVPLICVWGGKGFRDFFANFRSNLQWNRNLNLLTLGFLSLNFSLVLIRNIVARRKEIEFWCKTKNTVRCSIDNLIWSTNREVKDPQRAYFAVSLRATFRTNRNFFPTLFIICHFLFLSIREVLYSASSGSSLWARTLRGQKPTSGTYY